MNKEWIIKQVAKVLIEGGVDEQNAKWCAERAYDHFNKNICNSKDPMGETINYAGLLAETRSLTYKHKQIKPKSKPRPKRPPEVFGF